MYIHQEVLRAARRLCRERRDWTFRPNEVVRALPHLKESSVRTHIVSRCCVNAPKHHAHKWDYFRRVGRGLYEIRQPYRKESRPSPRGPRSSISVRPGESAAEAAAPYGSRQKPLLREAIHAAVLRGEAEYVAECLEIAVVTQGKTMDEVIFNLQEAIALHLEGEDREALGLSPRPRLVISYELPLKNAP